MKIYTLIKTSVVDCCEDVSLKHFDTEEQAIDALKEAAEADMEDMNSLNRWETEGISDDGLSYESYIDGEYCENHFSLHIEEGEIIESEESHMSMTERFDRVCEDAIKALKNKLKTAENGRIDIEDSKGVSALVIDSGNGYTWMLDPKTILLKDNNVHIFSDKVQESVIEDDSQWNDLQPDEYFCFGGELYAEWEGLLELIDATIS